MYLFKFLVKKSLELLMFGTKSKNETMGCEQYILTLLVTLFSTCKVKIIIFKKCNLLLTSQIK
jgi:hypothetical protein